ncbi:MAG TPA: sulfate adenylyltransferase [Candidatus Bilophila faecipullorum]|uniref:Sulfate adenylyltransferase n=1 Tax=Candidatus Bilophila faecipullorum TaxID=2838482 RepID=A0A9D1QYQ6_9BACT|nr:sulfate adenylyltransferase [uncultured Bilophila sp.]HIW77807.1 sulfate adenylyltransferase [Candidatus Bilophila faecipullorum]
MQTSFFTDVIVRKPALLQAMLAFNGVTAPVAPPVPAWDVPGFDAAALGEGLARIRGANVLPWRRPSSVAEEGFWDFADESRRLAFVGAEEAERLGLTFGVCVHAPELARIIAREQVLALREELGESLYRYGIQRGQYQLGGVRRFFLGRDVREPLLERMRRHGRLALALCCAGWPPVLRGRAGAWAAVEAEGVEGTPPEVRKAVWFGLKKLLLKEVAPQWAPCFD